jgi:hypothetical protein
LSFIHNQTSPAIVAASIARRITDKALEVGFALKSVDQCRDPSPDLNSPPLAQSGHFNSALLRKCTIRSKIALKTQAVIGIFDTEQNRLS